MNMNSIIFIQENTIENIVCQNGDPFVGLGVRVRGDKLMAYLVMLQQIVCPKGLALVFVLLSVPLISQTLFNSMLFIGTLPTMLAATWSYSAGE